MKVQLGVDTFIWSEMFSEEDLWIIEKAKNLGFSPLDIAVAKPESFPLDAVKKEAERVGMEVLTTTTLNAETNIVSPGPTGSGGRCALIEDPCRYQYRVGFQDTWWR